MLANSGSVRPMKSTAILTLMVADHAKILKLLTNIEKNLSAEVVSLLKLFDTFEWELEKHMFTEEKAIFTSYSPTNVFEGYSMVPELMRQHNEINDRLRAMRKNVMWQLPLAFTEFKELLVSHKTFEEVSLYPKLDQELDETQKQQIVSRIRQMVQAK
jgi:iron-sulfur cluster repair protein YtfE (RIC family)